MPKIKSTAKAPSKKPTSIVPNKKQIRALSPKRTQVQSKRLKTLLAQMPPIEKLDPKMYAKLRLTIHDTVTKALPEYQKWVGENIAIEEDCPPPTPVCSSCGNDCPTPAANRNIEQMVTSAVNQAMTKAIRQALEEQFK
ncbi:MAG TPA: hypothetical protein VF350_00040 [Candidatus Bathyarchaeia archaeon]